MTTDMLSWLRQQIETRKALAEEAHKRVWALLDQLVERPDGGADDRVVLVDADDFTELISVTLPGAGLDEDDLAHIAFNDPRQVIADCEADLAILETHALVRATLYGPPPADYEVACGLCHRRSEDIVVGRGICRTVRLTASRYRNRPGYQPHWAPEGTTP